jgi:putative peptidoglycan lipid II flippase
MIKIYSIFNKDASSIHHAAFWLAFFAIISGILGLLRDRLLAGTFGASRVLDIYYASFRVPDFLYTLMLFLASSTALIPMILKKSATDSQEAEKFLGSVLIFFISTVLIFSCAAFFLMPFFTDILFHGFSFSDKSHVTLLSRIMLFSPIFLGISNILSGVTQSQKKFFAYALSPVFYNFGIIFGVVFLLPVLGVPGLAFGVALGAFLHMAILLPSFLNSGFIPKFNSFSFPDLKKIIFLSIPRTLGLAANQFLIIFITSVATILPGGSVAIFNLAQNLEYIPITVLGLSYSVAAFPSLSSFSISKDIERFKEHFSAALRHIIFWTVPFSAILLILRAQIVRVILGSGVFSWQDTRLTAASLFLLSLSIVFQSLFLLLTRSFYAEGKTRRPLLVNIASAGLGILAVFSFLKILSPGQTFASFVSYILDISDIYDIRVLSLSLGILLSSIFNFFLLFFSFKSIFGWFPTQKIKKSIFQIFFGSFLGALSTYAGLNLFALIFNLQTFWGVFLQGFFSGILGIFTILVVLRVLKNIEFFEVLTSLKSTIWRDHVPTPEPDKLP